MRMHILVREISVPLIHKHISEARARLKQPETIRRRRALRRVDKELEKGNYKSALSLVKQLQGKPGGLRGFGAAQQVFSYFFRTFIGLVSIFENNNGFPFIETCLLKQKHVQIIAYNDWKCVRM